MTAVYFFQPVFLSAAYFFQQRIFSAARIFSAVDFFEAYGNDNSHFFIVQKLRSMSYAILSEYRKLARVVVFELSWAGWGS